MRAFSDLKPVADPAAVVAGERYRMTVITDGLIRLEYAPDGVFEDRPSAFALYRHQPVPAFTVTEEDGWLVVETDRVRLTYDGGPFTTNGLSAQVRGNVSNYHSVWRFGEPLETLGGTARTLDGIDGALPLEPGVVSRTGFSVVDDSTSPVLDGDWFAPRSGEPGRHDLYLFAYGLDHAEAVRALYAISGAHPVLPRWALGNWWSRYWPYSDEEYRALIERFEDADLPFSVAVLDMDWHRVADVPPQYGSGWTGYSWNRELFPDPEQFLAWLHERGLRVTLNVHPADGVRAFEDAYPAMCEALGRDPAAGEPVAFDVTDRAFMDAYFDVLHRDLERQGVDFWWIDWQQGPYSRLPGIDPLWVLNHLHFLDSCGALDGRGMTFSRYAGPGSHRYPIGFSGDSVMSWASLAFQPEFTATAANIGYGWWSHDIGGHYNGTRDDEMFARWVQFGVFSPILRLHSSDNPFLGKEPWRYGTEARRVVGEQLRLRHRLLPYLHTMNHRGAREGEPLVRPVYWTHPLEDRAYEARNEYWFGTEMVAVPITAPADREALLGAVEVWLPPGRWVDLFTEVVYEGDRPAALSRPLDSIPVLVREGGIVPLAPVDGPSTNAPERVEVVVVVGADGRFDLIEDDGTGDGLDPAHVATTPLRWDQAAGMLRIGPVQGATPVVPLRRTWVVRFPATGLPTVEVEAGVDDEAMVDVGPGARTTTADVHGRLFDLLDRAQIDIADKFAAWEVVTTDTSRAARLASLTALGLHRPVEMALVELLSAE